MRKLVTTYDDIVEEADKAFKRVIEQTNKGQYYYKLDANFLIGRIVGDYLDPGRVLAELGRSWCLVSRSLLEQATKNNVSSENLKRYVGIVEGIFKCIEGDDNVVSSIKQISTLFNAFSPHLRGEWASYIRFQKTQGYRSCPEVNTNAECAFAKIYLLVLEAGKPAFKTVSQATFTPRYITSEQICVRTQFVTEQIKKFHNNLEAKEEKKSKLEGKEENFVFVVGASSFKK